MPPSAAIKHPFQTWRSVLSGALLLGAATAIVSMTATYWYLAVWGCALGAVILVVTILREIGAALRTQSITPLRGDAGVALVGATGLIALGLLVLIFPPMSEPLLPPELATASGPGSVGINHGRVEVTNVTVVQPLAKPSVRPIAPWMLPKGLIVRGMREFHARGNTFININGAFDMQNVGNATIDDNVIASGLSLEEIERLVPKPKPGPKGQK